MRLDGLDDRVALVTGAGKGIGRAVALQLAGNGCDLSLFSRTRQYLEEVGREAEFLGKRVLVFAGDVMRKSDVVGSVTKTIETFGRIDVLVNNAGGGETHSAFTDITEEAWDRIVGFNLKSVFLFCQAVVPHMIKQGRGKIINISSYVAKAPIPLQPDYCAAKAGVNAFTQSLAKELARYHINVNAVLPGWTDTPGLRGWARIHLERFPQAAASVDELCQQLVRDYKIPLDKLGTADDVANAVAFLASSNSDYMTGELVNVSGGLEMR